MYNVLTLNKIANCGIEKLGENYNISDSCENPDGIILRSFSMHEMELPATLKGIARAGAGAAVSVILMIPPIIVFLYSQNSVMETMSHSGLK